MESLPPIPTPPAQRWREFRIQILPIIVFVGIIAAIAIMWKSFVQPSGVVGEVEAVRANVISLHDGIVAELNVDRLQYVTNGQVLGKIVSTDPDVLKATVVSIQADLQVLRARMRLDENRNHQSLLQMRLDLRGEKMLREVAYASLTLSSNMLYQSQFLENAGIESRRELAIYKAEYDKAEREITVRSQAIQDYEVAIKAFEAEATVPNDPVIENAIKAKEDELEETLKPANIRAPMTGIVSIIYRRADERVVRGEPILTISATTAERIVGYIRQPVQKIPAENDVVVVRTRTQRRQVGEGQILKVGAQFEAINPALLSTDSNRVEMGLPILVSLPKGMTVSPGEFVDLSIRYAKQ
jgi:multidrug resistance efflux pump